MSQVSGVGQARRITLTGMTNKTPREEAIEKKEKQREAERERLEAEEQRRLR